MQSFTTLVRKEICKLEEKQKLCCAFSYLYGMFYSVSGEEDKKTFSTNAENVEMFKKTCLFINSKKKLEYSIDKRKVSVNTSVFRYSTIAEIANNVFKCEHCRTMFLRGLFMSRSSVNDPEKSYRIEFVFNKNSSAAEVKELLLQLGFEFKIFERKNKYVAYSKNNEVLSDILGLIGANSCAFSVINTKIMKELRNEANRISNCDSANIDKTLKANEKYIVAIRYLIDNNKLSLLSEELQEMALKRLEFESLTLNELGKRFSPPISKSGVFHRLEKILSIYENNR